MTPIDVQKRIVELKRSGYSYQGVCIEVGLPLHIVIRICNKRRDYEAGATDTPYVTDKPWNCKTRAAYGWEASGDLPETPCDAWPGSRAKIEALADRAMRGLALFHPDDFTASLR